MTQDIVPKNSHSMNHVLQIYCWNEIEIDVFSSVKPTVETSKQWMMFHSCQVLPIREAIWFMADGVLITPSPSHVAIRGTNTLEKAAVTFCWMIHCVNLNQELTE